MPRTPSQNQAIKDKRRGKLIVHSLKAFAINGFDHTSVDDITKSARCSHGLFYHYFDSQEEAYKAVANDLILAQNKLDYENYGNDWMAGLKSLLSFVEVACQEGGRDAQIVALLLDADKAKKLDDFGREFAAAHSICKTLLGIVEKGQAEGKIIPGNAGEIALALTNLIAANIAEATNSKEPKLVSADVLLALVLA